MRGRRRGDLPARLVRLEQRFAEWRKTRARGQRIPEALWKAAARSAADYGLNLTATALKLEYYALKRRMERAGARPGSKASAEPLFIELPAAALEPSSAPSATHASECVIEWADGTGASMRVHLKGTPAVDVLALGRGFWGGQ